MTLLALQAGKHVYLEKPSGHDPREDELLMDAARKYPLKIQLARGDVPDVRQVTAHRVRGSLRIPLPASGDDGLVLGLRP